LYSSALTLAGDLGLGIGFLGWLLVVLVGIAVFFLSWAIYTARHPRNADRPPNRYHREGIYVLAVGVVFLVLSAFTFPFIPVVSFSKLRPTQFVSVQAQQFSWTLNSTKVIANQPVEFIVTSKATTQAIMANSIALVASSLLLFSLGFFGYFYLGVALALGSLLLYSDYLLMLSNSAAVAWRAQKFTAPYLLALSLAMVANKAITHVVTMLWPSLP